MHRFSTGSNGLRGLACRGVPLACSAAERMADFWPASAVAVPSSAGKADKTVFMLTRAMDWGYNHELLFFKPSFRVYS